ncbi:MAG: carbonic anhydrase [Actinomycetes bacterium]
MKAFEDIFSANAQYVKDFKSSALTGQAARGLAIITCIDSRIAPLAIMGMQPGDAKIIRNAGARVTEDVLRTLVLATHLLNVSRILVMPHTDCRMASGTEAEIHAAILEKSGVDTRSIEIRTVRDPLEALEIDLDRIRSFPLLAANIEVAGAIFNVATGELRSFV